MDEKALQAWKERKAHKYADKNDDEQWDSTSVWSAHHNGFKEGISAGEQVWKLIGSIEALNGVKHALNPGFLPRIEELEAHLAELLSKDEKR